MAWGFHSKTLAEWGKMSLSFDKGFTRTQDRELLSLYVPTVVMP